MGADMTTQKIDPHEEMLAAVDIAAGWPTT
jgi:hypothetical protein